MKRVLQPAASVPPGRLFVLLDLIDGERRLTFYRRGDDGDAVPAFLQRPEIWCRARRLGLIQYREDGTIRARRRSTYTGAQFIDRRALVHVRPAVG